MVGWVELNDELSKAGRRDQLLRTKFNEFAKQATDQITAQHYLVKGLEAELHLDESYFVVRFVGKALQFRLEMLLNESNVLVGAVNCFVEKGFPDVGFRKLGSIGFKPGGETDLKEPESGDLILIDSDVGAPCIVLDFVYKSLSS